MERSSEMAETPRRMNEENRGPMELERELALSRATSRRVETDPNRQHLDHQIYLSTLFLIVACCLFFDRVLGPLCEFLYCFPSCDGIFLPQGPENDDELWR